MGKKLLILALSFMLIVPFCYAKDKNKTNKENIKNIGNVIQKEEYPEATNVAPYIKDNEAYVVEGSVEKNVDVTLNECIRYALGNNPRIREAMEDILASDARVKQAWSNFFPKLTWQTGYTRIKQLQLADLLGSQGGRAYTILF